MSGGVMVAGRFERGRLLGKGGMGTVYEAEDTVLGRPVALKFLRPELASDPEMVARFQREVRAIGRLRSPNVVSVHDVGEDPEAGLFMVLEKLDGESLHDVIAQRSPLSIQQASAIAAQALAALRVAHEAGVIHRDLKPDNIFVLEDGTVKVLDFGIAHLLEGQRTLPGRDTESRGEPPPSPTLTHPGRVLGTALYIAPELLTKQPPGPAADLYSLGVVIFEMIAGRPPFESLDSEELCQMHLAMPPPPLASLNETVPADLARLVQRMLAKEPSARPSAERVGAVLERHRTGPATAPRRPAAWAAAAVAVLLTTAGGIAWWAARPAPETPIATPTPSTSGPAARPAEGPSEPEEGSVERLTPTITLEVAGLPASAELRWDGERVANPWTTDQGAEVHRLDVIRAGRVETFEVVPDESRVIELPSRPHERRRRRRLPAKLREW